MYGNIERFAGEIQAGLARDREEEERPRLETFSAAELQRMILPPVQWLVDGLVVRGGLGVLAAPSKYGKSWLCLDLCRSIATGQDFLGFQTSKARTLYLALEDSKQRLQARQRRQAPGDDAPENFEFALRSGTTATKLFAELEEYVERYPDTALIVVDTLQKIRGKTSSTNMYAEDYDEAGRLKEFADAHGLTILLVHHLRKMKDEDPFAMISGSVGIMGAADFACVLTKNKRQDEEAVLFITGRDVEENEYKLRFEKEFCTWENIGTVAEVEDQRAKMYYTTDPIVTTIKALLKADSTWTGSTKQFKQAVTATTGFDVSDNERAFSGKISSYSALLNEYDFINYERISNGSGGGKHHFWKDST